VQARALAPDGFNRVNGGGDSGLLVGGAPAVNPSVAVAASVRIDTPPLACGHYVEMPVEVQQRPSPVVVERADYIDARVLRRVLGIAFGSDVLHFVAELAQAAADQLRTRRVILTRRIDRRDRDELLQELHHFIAHRLNAVEDGLF
jgi:hypothetical protein